MSLFLSVHLLPEKVAYGADACQHLAWALLTINTQEIARFLFFFKILFIYLTERESKAEGAGEGEVRSPLSWEPDVGLDPRTLRS